MRRVLLGLLATSSLAACNWVFGLDKTEPAPPDDAGDGGLPSGKPVKLTYLVATTSATGDPQDPIEAPIEDLVLVEGSTLDGALRAPLTYGADGTIVIPFDMISAPWRLVYQRTNQPPRELQLLPENAHLIEPLFGPVPPRTQLLTGAGYTFSPAGGPASHNPSRVFTMGTFTEGQPQTSAGTTILYEFGVARSLSGPLGKPAATDQAIEVDYTTDVASNCRTSIGSSDGHGDAGPPPPTFTGPYEAAATLPSITENATSLTNQLGAVSRNGESFASSRQNLGYMFSAKMPAFTRRPDNTDLLALPNPAMFTLRSCPDVINGSAPPMLHDVAFLQDHLLPSVVYTELTVARTLPSGATLINGIEVVSPEVTNDAYVVVQNAPSPTAVTLTTSGGVMVSLFGAADRIAVPDVSGVLDLSWTSASGTADYWEVTLLEVTGNLTVRKRVFVTPATELKVDGTYFTSGHEYVFEIASFTGRPGASVGEYRHSSLPQSSSLANTRSFLAP